MGKKRILAAVALGVALLVGFVTPIGDTVPAFAAINVEDQTPAAGAGAEGAKDPVAPEPEAPAKPAPTEDTATEKSAIEKPAADETLPVPQPQPGDGEELLVEEPLSASAFASPLLSVFSVPGTPGTMQPPTDVWTEDFEDNPNSPAPNWLANATGNNLTDTGQISRYRGKAPNDQYPNVNGGTTYPAPGWGNISYCNGIRMSAQNTNPNASNNALNSGYCGRIIDAANRTGWWNVLGSFAGSIGTMSGGGQSNKAAGYITNDNISPANTQVYQTQAMDMVSYLSDDWPSQQQSRYYSSGIDVSAADNSSSPPQLRVWGSASGTGSFSQDMLGSDPNPWSGTYAHSGTSSNGTAFRTQRYQGLTTAGVNPLVTRVQAAKLQIEVRNSRTTASYNDFAIDNVRLIDRTPQLDKQFKTGSWSTGSATSSSSIATQIPMPPSTGTASQLWVEFTITNTSDRAAKSNFGFTEQLPAGLRIYTNTTNNQRYVTNCSGATVTAASNTDTVQVSRADFSASTSGTSASTTSCVVRVRVMPTTPGVFEIPALGTGANDPGTTSLTGVNAPAATTVEIQSVSGTKSVALCTNANCTTSTAMPAKGTAVDAGSVLRYTLTLRNPSSSLAAVISTTNTDANWSSYPFRDYLADVLDDADLSNASGTLTPAGTFANTGFTGTPTVALIGAGSTRAVEVRGTIPANTSGALTATVTFYVKVKSNEADSAARAAGNLASSPSLVGYVLNNYLVKTTDASGAGSIPASCEASNTDCTQNPIRAWTIEKGSQPENGAMIHVGGNIYYRVKITNFSGATLSGVKISDDLTETLAATVWDPAAPPLVEQPNGLSFYRADGTRITSATYDKTWATTGDRPVFSGSSAFDPDFPNGKPFPGGKWVFSNAAGFDIPATIGSDKVAYAIVGYAVKGGYVASPTDPAVQYSSVDGPVAALPKAQWVNTAQAGTATPAGGTAIYPNQCSAAGAGIAPGNTGNNLNCKTTHELGDSYFHIWKKSNSPIGANLLNSTFMLSDTEADARAGVPSRWLCRIENRVPNPADVNSNPSAAPGSTIAGTPDFGAASTAHASISQANLARSAYNIDNGFSPTDAGYRPALPQCGQFYYLSVFTGGQQAGTWRAVDVRGGDLAAGGTAPLANWRTASAANDPANPATAGQHGTYWLVETKSPTDHQLLAQPMKLWVAPEAMAPSGLNQGTPAYYDYQGRLSMPVVGVGENSSGVQGMGGVTDASAIRKQCANLTTLPVNNQPNCVMPTGWTMPVFDVKMKPLPLTGGYWFGPIVLGGGVILAFALIGIWWWRQRKMLGAPEPRIEPVGDDV